MRIKAFHGTGSFIEKFNLNHLNGGEHQYGPGIYFSNNIEDTIYYSKGYGENGGNGNTYEVEFKLKQKQIVTMEFNISKNIIKEMILNSPFKIEGLSNYGEINFEGYDNVLKYAIESYENMNIVEFINSIDNDFYKNDSKKCLENFVKISDIKVIEINSNGHIIYNVISPDIIISLKNLNLEAEKKYKENFKKNNSKIYELKI